MSYVDEMIKKRNEVNERLNVSDNIERKNSTKEYVIKIIDSLIYTHAEYELYQDNEELSDEIRELDYETIMKTADKNNAKLVEYDYYYNSQYIYHITKELYREMLEFSNLDSEFYDYACDLKKLLKFVSYRIERDIELERHSINQADDYDDEMIIDYMFLYELAEDIAFEYDLLECVYKNSSLHDEFHRFSRQNLIADENIRRESKSSLIDFVRKYNFSMPFQLETKKDYFHRKDSYITITQDTDVLAKALTESKNRFRKNQEDIRDICNKKYKVSA